MKIAILIPCYNEALSIGKVVSDFRREIPNAEIHVYDNNSTDNSASIAKESGAIIHLSPQQGKGFVVRQMFREIDADVYVMVDADDTYPAEDVHKLIKPIVDGEADMVNGDRLTSTYYVENKRLGHNFGNSLVCFLIRLLWGVKVHDVMTGYRAFSRFFVKMCPVLSNGFEIETEMTIHTIDKRMALKEIPIGYRDRQANNPSKLNTLSDGIRVLRTIFNLFVFYRPGLFFSMVGVIAMLISVGMFCPVMLEYLKTGLVPRQPTLIVSGFFAIASLLSLVCGLLLNASKKASDQMFELMAARA